MTELLNHFSQIRSSKDLPKESVINETESLLKQNDFTIEEIDKAKPWGGFIRLQNDDANRFVECFFEGLDPIEARLGNPQAELSPKILIVSPGHRLSWQYHNRRAERWRFLNDGAYHKSLTDESGGLRFAEKDTIVQFDAQERHRLIGALGHYTLVAEIWQHTDLDHSSDEQDIIRLQDDYSR